MGKIFLAGHTGSVNKGCEAIVRSTVKLLRENGVYDITLFTNNEKDDYTVGLNTICTIVSTTVLKKFDLRKVLAKLALKVFGNYYFDEKLQQKSCFNLVDTGDVVFIIGGDTYCYSRPVSNYAANRFAHERGAKTVLWGCSLEKKLLTQEMINDLNTYDFLCPRETLSEKVLMEIGISEDKILRIADPAFSLNTVKGKAIFGDTDQVIGLNISPIVRRNPKAYDSVMCFLSHIIEQTEYKILLVPHVYHEGMIDAWELKEIKKHFPNASERFIEIDNELSCEQIKYYIARCKIFIGARTHSTIAAYSSGIPTIVIGYSVKSEGIAKDLFGDTENYVLPVDELNGDKLIKAFSYVENNFELIRQNLSSTTTIYKKSTQDAIKTITERLNVTKRNLLYWNKDSCSGCGACAAICPLNCISMEEDENGFIYPIVDEALCIHCGKCHGACHYKKKENKKTTHDLLGVVNLDSNIRKLSSSGGVFWSIGKEIINKGGVVFGCALDSDMKVIHMCAQSLQELKLLLGSKYVQSNAGIVYKDVEARLKDGQTVLFSGTPCQINGLYSFLGKEYENLYTIDFICHGVPSPMVWEKYLQETEKKYQGKAVSVSFRDKTEGWKRFSMRIVFDNEKIYQKNVAEDPFLRSFIADVCLRESCTNCAAKGIDRPSDFTVADLWGAERMFPDFSDDKGASALIVRGDKSHSLFKTIEKEFKSQKLDIKTLVATNPSILKSVSKNSLRKGFFNELRNKSFFSAYSCYASLSLRAKIHRRLGK